MRGLRLVNRWLNMLQVNLFDTLESNVCSYCRGFPAVFERALGATQWDDQGRRYIDFFAGAGALNYGHNHPEIKAKVLEFLSRDMVLHALDMHTGAKLAFMQAFQSTALAPRGLHYKLQFTGPTGTNAVEAALKVVRRVTKRAQVWAFSGGFHGMSLGALAVTANFEARQAAGVPLAYGSFLPFAANEAEIDSSLHAIRTALDDGHSGMDKPAAFIVETVQAEGGINVAPARWLQGLRALATEHDILLVVDDIQVGCYRTGEFFSFDEAGIEPDLVVLSKSIGGLGFPMSLLLIKPELDIWQPGEHTGTFRGNQLAFVAGAAALDLAQKLDMPAVVRQREQQVREGLTQRMQAVGLDLPLRGRGLIWGIDMANAGGGEAAKRVARACFANGLMVERAGRQDCVVKLLPPLLIEPALLDEGLDILVQALRSTV
jgi:diaminobutyrate-2-oxoglutarate transaminase